MDFVAGHRGHLVFGRPRYAFNYQHVFRLIPWLKLQPERFLKRGKDRRAAIGERWKIASASW
jgi:hypothetical protein